jgi:hypothetical protein
VKDVNNELKKWHTAADLRLEVTKSLNDWLHEPENTPTLEEAFKTITNRTAPEPFQFSKAKDNIENDTEDSSDDSDNDSDYNPQDDAGQEDDDDSILSYDDSAATLPPPPELNTSHFLRGFIPRDLTDRQEAFYRQQKMDRRYYTGHQWTTNLINFQWKATHEVWLQRCKDLHDTEESIGSAREKQEAEAKTRAMYKQAAHMNSLDRQHCFDVPIDDRLASSTRNLKAWVKQMYPIVQLAVKDALAQAKNGLQDIRNFLTRAPPAPNITAPTTTNDTPPEATEPIAVGINPAA